jgi:L-asparaginase/Glu-tRNA(Gln) amidotransferase subunit D
MPKLRIIHIGGTIGGKHGSGGVIREDIYWKEFINLLYKKYPSLKRDLERKKVELHDFRSRDMLD